MLNLKKLEKIAFLSFDNALRLHFDSIALYRDGRYPSAFFLSVLSQEEIGKMHMINHFVFHSRDTGQEEELEDKWLELLYKHPHKQYSFLSNSPLIDYVREMELMDSVFKGELEAKKQGSVYVGLKKYKGKVDTKGKIIHPYKVTKKKSYAQISEINDYLLVTGVGVRFGQFSLDNEAVENILKNRRFLTSIHRNWKRKVGSRATKRIRGIQKFFKEVIVPV